MKEIEKLYIVETSLAKNEKLTADQKFALACQLQKLNVDAIEINPEEKDLITKLKPEIKEITVTASALPRQDSLDETWNALESFAIPRLRIKLDPELLKEANLNNLEIKNDLIKMVKDSIKYAKKLTDNVEFIVVKYKDIHKMFLYRILEATGDSDVKIMTVTDKDSIYLTHEYAELFDNIMYNLPEFDKLILGVSCRNKLGLATSNTLAAINYGARQADVNLIGSNKCSDNASLKSILKTCELRNDVFKLTHNLNLDELDNSFKMLKDFING